MTTLSRDVIDEIIDVYVKSGDLISEKALNELSESSGIPVRALMTIYTNLYQSSNDVDDDPWGAPMPIL